MPENRGAIAASHHNDTSPNWSTLLGKAIDDVSRIAQAEIRLLGVHINASVEKAIESILPILLACALFIGAEACLLAAAVLLLHHWLPWWISFGVAGLAALMVGFVLVAVVRTVTKKVLVHDTGSSLGSN